MSGPSEIGKASRAKITVTCQRGFCCSPTAVSLHEGLALIKLLRTWRVASGFGSLCDVAIILPIQVGLPLDAQRGAIPQGSDANMPLAFRMPRASNREGIKARQGGMTRHVL